MKGQKLSDGRNYTLDLIRVIAAVLMTSFHWIWFVYFPGHIDNGYWGAYFFTQQHFVEGWDWFKGTYTMGFFVFVTGYFMMDNFKRLQRKGAFDDQRTHFTHVWRYTAKTYVAYAPLMLFGTAWGWILTNGAARASLAEWVNTFVWNIWQFLGVSGFGMFQNNATAFVNVYCGPAWYIAAFMVFCCAFYTFLVKDEKVAVFVVCPIMFAASNIWLNQWLDPVTGAQTCWGITTLLPQDVVRLWGPLSLGVWGWYLADALKRAKLTEKQESMLSVVLVVALAYALITSWTGYLGGMLNQDIVWMIVAALVIVHRDPFTLKLDELLHKFPLAKYMADFSGGLYLVHLPLVNNFGAGLIERFGLPTAPWVFEGLCVVSAILFMVVNKLLLKPLYGRLGKVLHAREPVVVPAEAVV